MFPTTSDAILKKVAQFRPESYSQTRNFTDGSVSRLSPYISRGVISTRFVMEAVLRKTNGRGSGAEKFIQELAWRDYWQQVWVENTDLINNDLRQPQESVEHYAVPAAIVDATTGISAVDNAINDFYNSGYLHNHVRLYIASICCNIGKAHWRFPAMWMYFHLLDGDWGSNALSWQWVAGSNSGKKYYANQANINTFCHTLQTGTFLDKDYTSLGSMDVPAALRQTVIPHLETALPLYEKVQLDKAKPLFIYNYYNLDFQWRKNEDANRVLLLEPSVFDTYPVSQKAVDFTLSLADNIPGVKVFTGSFEELAAVYGGNDIIFKEHPLNNHYRGTEDAREWMFSVKGDYPSFSSFWKKCQEELNYSGLIRSGR